MDVLEKASEAPQNVWEISLKFEITQIFHPATPEAFRGAPDRPALAGPAEVGEARRAWPPAPCGTREPRQGPRPRVAVTLGSGIHHPK